MFTEKQLDELQTDIRLTIAEDDTEVSEVEDCVCECGVSVLTNEGVDKLASLARCAIESFADTHPVDMLLFCPKCNAQHIDQPQPEKNWKNPPHRSHECQACGYVWRPADVATNGVATLNTKGNRDRDPKPYPCIVGRMGASLVLKDGTKVSIERGEGAHDAHVWLTFQELEKIVAA